MGARKATLVEITSIPGIPFQRGRAYKYSKYLDFDWTFLMCYLEYFLSDGVRVNFTGIYLVVFVIHNSDGMEIT